MTYTYRYTGPIDCNADRAAMMADYIDTYREMYYRGGQECAETVIMDMVTNLLHAADRAKTDDGAWSTGSTVAATAIACYRDELADEQTVSYQ